MQPPLLFGLGSWLTFTVASLVSVYALDQYEHAWGYAKTFQVEAWIGLLGGFIAMVAFGFAAAFTKRAHAKIPAFVLGIAAGVFYVAVCGLIVVYAPSASVFTAVLLLLAISAIASQLGHKYD
jgi:hypothetical protein